MSYYCIQYNIVFNVININTKFVQTKTQILTCRHVAGGASKTNKLALQSARGLMVDSS